MLEAAIERWILTKAALDKNTVRHYRKVLKLYASISPEWPPDQASLIRFITTLQSQGYKDSTIQVYWTATKTFILWLVRRKLITDNPLIDLAGPRAPGDIPRAPPARELEKLFNYLENEVERVLKGKKRYSYWGWREIRNLALFSLLLDTGLRISEALSIQLGDVDLENWSIFVAAGKGKRQRYVAIGRTARADLRLWLRIRTLIPMPETTPGLNYLFISRRVGWTPMAPTNAEAYLKRVCERLEIEPYMTPHQLRHAYVVYSLQQGANIEQVRQQMGHIHLTTTARYAHSVLGEDRIKKHLATSPRDFLF